MRILALDNSTNRVGWAIFDGLKLEEYGLIELEKEIKSHDEYLNKDYLERIHLMKNILSNMVVSHKIDVVGMEDIALVSFGGKSNNNQVNVFKKLAKALGAYEVSLIDKQIAFDTIGAGTWRLGKKLGRKRDEIKGNTIKYINEKFSLSLREYNPKSKDNDDDIADAIGIGYYLAQKMNKIK